MTLHEFTESRRTAMWDVDRNCTCGWYVTSGSAQMRQDAWVNHVLAEIQKELIRVALGPSRIAGQPDMIPVRIGGSLVLIDPDWDDPEDDPMFTDPLGDELEIKSWSQAISQYDQGKRDAEEERRFQAEMREAYGEEMRPDLRGS